MLQGRSGAIGRTLLPVHRQLLCQEFLTVLPGCEAGQGLVGWLVSLWLISAWCCTGTRVWQGWGMVGTSHSIPSGASAWQRCFSCCHQAGQVPLQHSLAMIPATGHPPLHRALPAVTRGCLPCVAG